ncbi:MAG: hypothetical protein ACFFGZ_07235 [Candidatus Thorarchaeota archaeon]
MLIGALLIGNAESEQKAKQTANKYRNCPFVSLMALKGSQVFMTLFIPEEHDWWVDYIAQNPELSLKLQDVQVTYFDDVRYPEPLTMHLPEEALKITPCGSNCENCPAYESESCPGCPATVFYKK